MININGVEFELDTYDLEIAGKVEKELKRVPERLKTIGNTATRTDIIKNTVMIVSDCFNNIFGEGTSEKIFKGKKNLKLSMKSFEELAIGLREEDKSIEKEFDEAIKKYSPNRLQRRDNKQK